jgi:hypothetical protein
MGNLSVIGLSMLTFNRLLLAVSIFGLVATAHAVPAVELSETIWCKKLKMGCKTPEERAKAIRFCKQLADEIYMDSLIKAIDDPSIWQYAGDNSAQDYARSRKDSMMYICIKRS